MLFVSAGHPCGWPGWGLCTRSLLLAVTHIWGFAGCCGQEWHHPRCGTRLSERLQRTDQALRRDIPLAVCAACHISLVAPVTCLLGAGLRPSKLVPPMGLQGGAGQRWHWCLSPGRMSLCPGMCRGALSQGTPASPAPSGSIVSAVRGLGAGWDPVPQPVLFHVGHCQPAMPHREATKGCRGSLKPGLHSLVQEYDAHHGRPLCSSRGGGGQGTWQGEGRGEGAEDRNNSQKLQNKIQSQCERLAICCVGAGAGAIHQPRTAAAARAPPVPSDSAPGGEDALGTLGA